MTIAFFHLASLMRSCTKNEICRTSFSLVPLDSITLHERELEDMWSAAPVDAPYSVPEDPDAYRSFRLDTIEFAEWRSRCVPSQ